MRTLRTFTVFSLFCLFFNSATFATSGNCEFVTGEDIWNQKVIHHQFFIAGQFRPRHAQFTSNDNIYETILQMGQAGEIYCPVHFRIGLGEDINLELLVEREGLAQCQLFLAFNKSMVEIFDTTDFLLQNSKFLRSDVTTVKNYLIDVLLFLKKIENITQTMFTGNESIFDQKAILNDIKHGSYLEASIMNEGERNFIAYVKKFNGSKVSLHEYINHHVNQYYDLFKNMYYSTNSHLIDNRTAKTRMLLNRKQDGNLKDFKFSFEETETIPLPKLIHLLDAKSNNSPRIVSTVSTGDMTTTTSEKKKRRKNPNKNGPQSQPTQNQTVTENEPKEVGSATQTQPDEVKEETTSTLTPQVPTTEQPQNEGIQTVASETQDDLAKETATTLASEENNTTNTLEISESQKVSRPSTPVRMTNADMRQEVSRLQRLEQVLEEFDGGAHKGMKTRNFLSLCTSLNKLGYFSSFEANKKEVKIKINPSDTTSTGGIVTVMHTNHSGKKQDTGITRPTAEKMNEVIDLIKEKESSTGTQ